MEKTCRDSASMNPLKNESQRDAFSSNTNLNGHNAIGHRYADTYSHKHIHTSIGVDSGGQPGHAPPNNEDGGQNPFLAPPIIRREFFIFGILKEKITWKKAETETKKEKYKETGVDFE